MMRQALIPIFALLGACASAPHGEFYGAGAARSEPNTRDLRLVWIDGVLLLDPQADLVGSKEVVFLEPGHHTLDVVPAASENEGLRELTLDVEPCVRYNYVAKDSGDAWQPVLIGTTVISRCRLK